jgi:Mn-dependent DtxR family transcriptional regulator
MKAEGRVIEILQRHGPATSRELAEILALKRSTVSATLSRLKKYGYLKDAGRLQITSAYGGRPPRLFGIAT